MAIISRQLLPYGCHQGTPFPACSLSSGPSPLRQWKRDTPGHSCPPRENPCDEFFWPCSSMTQPWLVLYCLCYTPITWAFHLSLQWMMAGLNGDWLLLHSNFQLQLMPMVLSLMEVCKTLFRNWRIIGDCRLELSEQLDTKCKQTGKLQHTWGKAAKLHIILFYRLQLHSQISMRPYYSVWCYLGCGRPFLSDHWIGSCGSGAFLLAWIARENFHWCQLSLKLLVWQGCSVATTLDRHNFMRLALEKLAMLDTVWDRTGVLL